MVVIHSQPSASTKTTTLRKNRRKIIRKAPRRADDIPPAIAEIDVPKIDAQGTGVVSKTQPPVTAPAADDDELMIDAEAPSVPHTSAAPAFPPLPASAMRSGLKSETRRIPIPPHRMTPLKKDWVNIFGPLTDILGLQVRMNVHRRCVEARVRLGVSDLIVIQLIRPGRHRSIRRTLVHSKKVPTSSKLMLSDLMSM